MQAHGRGQPLPRDLCACYLTRGGFLLLSAPICHYQLPGNALGESIRADRLEDNMKTNRFLYFRPDWYTVLRLPHFRIPERTPTPSVATFTVFIVPRFGDLALIREELV